MPGALIGIAVGSFFFGFPGKVSSGFGQFLYQFAFKMETEAAARSPTRKRVPGRTEQYVEESDADTAPASGYPEGIHLKANWY
jgi:hypothetical protein